MVFARLCSRGGVQKSPYRVFRIKLLRDLWRLDGNSYLGITSCLPVIQEECVVGGAPLNQRNVHTIGRSLGTEGEHQIDWRTRASDEKVS